MKIPKKGVCGGGSHWGGLTLDDTMHKRGHNESGCRFSLEKMPSLIAYKVINNRKMNISKTLQKSIGATDSTYNAIENIYLAF